MRQFPPFLLTLMVAAAASAPALATPSRARIVLSAQGDEATINAHAMDLDARLRAAEKSKAMSHAEADRHSRALARMVRSAKEDLRRPPHFISAAGNATYRRTIASVDAALKRVRR